MPMLRVFQVISDCKSAFCSLNRLLSFVQVKISPKDKYMNKHTMTKQFNEKQAFQGGEKYMKQWFPTSFDWSLETDGSLFLGSLKMKDDKDKLTLTTNTTTTKKRQHFYEMFCLTLYLISVQHSIRDFITLPTCLVWRGVWKGVSFFLRNCLWGTKRINFHFCNVASSLDWILL